MKQRRKLFRVYDVKGRAVKLRLRYLVLMLVGVAFVGGAVIYFPVALTSDPAFCNRCHSMEQAVGQWKASTHANVNCTFCHVDPGLVPSLEHKVEALKEVYDEFIGDPAMPATIKQPKNVNCLQCHTVNRTVSPSGDLKIPHKLHVDIQGLLCTDCHFSVVHSLRGTPGGPPPMDVCYMCHDGKKAPNTCSTCHNTPQAQLEAQGHPATQNILETHGALADQRVEDCYRCHSQTSHFCENCHSVPPASHAPPNWRYTHSVEVQAKGRQVCLGCHTEQFCSKCHTVSHPTDWVQTHGPSAQGALENCLVCHSTGFCNQCHAPQGLPTY